MRGYLLKLDKWFKSCEHLKIEKKILKIRTSSMGALLEKQPNLWENCVNPGVASKFIKKTVTLKWLLILTPNFDSR